MTLSNKQLVIKNMRCDALKWYRDCKAYLIISMHDVLGKKQLKGFMDLDLILKN